MDNLMSFRAPAPSTVCRSPFGSSRGAPSRTRVAAWILLCACVLAPAAHAVIVSGLYDAAVPVADRSEAVRNQGFAAALAVVAVRVSGSRDAAGRLSTALGNARRYVQRFTYSDGGLLQVGFDSTAVDQALVDAGLPLWGRERPATLIYLADNSSGAGAERTALENAARLRGLPLVWPALSSEDQSLLQQAPGDGAAMDTLLARYGANAALVGRSSHNPGEGAAMRWTLQFEGASNTAQGSIEDGIDLAATAFARTFAARPGSASEVLVDVGNIRTLKSYAETLNYLEGLTLVRAVSVDRVQGDTVSFRLAVRADARTLRRAIGLGRKLIPDRAQSGELPAPETPSGSGAAAGGPAAAAGGDRLRLRYPD
jgi:hypothetical protein